MNDLICMVCGKKANIMAYGNSYCQKCFKLSPYYMEQKARKELNEEKRKKQPKQD